MSLTTGLEVEILAFIANKGVKCDIYGIFAFVTSPQFTEELKVAELRLTLRKMELQGIINLSYKNTSTTDRYGYRQIAEIRLLV